jgi:hypothetical protein
MAIASSSRAIRFMARLAGESGLDTTSGTPSAAAIGTEGS